MSTYVGGLRARLIADSLYTMVRDALEDLGWFAAGRQHQAINMRPESVPENEQIPLNTLAVSQLDVSDLEAELGSNLTEDRWTFYVDFFAENDVVGKHLIHDVRDILRGKYPSIGRSAPILRVYDYTQATPPVLFTVEIENVVVDQAHDFPQSWRRYWYMARCELVDAYGDEEDD